MDTSAWFALQNRRDKNHAAAIKFWAEIQSKKHRLITTDRIREESATLIQRKLGKAAALYFSELLEVGAEQGEIIIIEITPDMEKEAWGLFQQRRDKDYSFVDCTTFCVASRYQYGCAFAFDSDFADFGVEIVPEQTV